MSIIITECMDTNLKVILFLKLWDICKTNLVFLLYCSYSFHLEHMAAVGNIIWWRPDRAADAVPPIG